MENQGGPSHREKTLSGNVVRQQGMFVALVCGGMTALLGILGLLGWLTSVRILASVRTNYIPMAPDTAVDFVLLGVVLLLKAKRTMRPRVRGAIAVVVAMVMAYSLLKF